jgi:hypothetical protein
MHAIGTAPPSVAKSEVRLEASLPVAVFERAPAPTDPTYLREVERIPQVRPRGGFSS